MTATGPPRKAGASADPGARTLPRRCRRTRDEDPEEGPPCAARRAGSRPGDPAAVHLGHRPALRARVAAPPGGPPTRTASTTCPRLLADGATWSSSASSAAAGTGRRGSTRVLAAGLPVVVLGGEQAPDAELMELSTVPAGVAAEAHTYLAQGGPENLAQLHAFLSDTVLLTGEGFAPPVELPSWGMLERDAHGHGRPDRRRPLLPRPAPRREHRATSRRCAPRSRTPARRPLPVFCASLRRPSPRCCDAARGGRDGRHRARRGRHEARARVRGRRRRGVGRRASWPRWTCRSCRASA